MAVSGRRRNLTIRDMMVMLIYIDGGDSITLFYWWSYGDKKDKWVAESVIPLDWCLVWALEEPEVGEEELVFHWALPKSIQERQSNLCCRIWVINWFREIDNNQEKYNNSIQRQWIKDCGWTNEFYYLVDGSSSPSRTRCTVVRLDKSMEFN